MKQLEEDLRLEGYRLKRYLFLPDSTEQTVAVAMHFHGQGDYSERYRETCEVFAARGVACVSTDLPGHGQSSGRRGVVPGFDYVDQVARSNRECCRKLCPEGPLGILGHSAGGLMALRELLARPEPYAFSWISSPLLRPEANQQRILLSLAPLLAKIAPGLTVSTKVTGEQCRHSAPDDEESDDDGLLFHSRVSIGWGSAMIEAAAAVRRQLTASPPEIPFLLTQGDADPVCPPRYLRDVLSRASIPQLTYHEYPGALHEPFADTAKAQVFADIDSWLKETLPALLEA